MVGDLKYMTGKLCRKGHYSPRYTSSGNCIECMDERLKISSIRNKSAQRIRNASKGNGDPELYSGVFPIDWHAILNAIRIVAQSSDIIHQQNIIASVTGKPATWDRAAFLAAGVEWSGQHMVNAAKFPIGAPFSIKIGGIWWPGVPLLTCLRGDLPSVSPCDYIPTIEVQP